jgi:hypothetical protein
MKPETKIKQLEETIERQASALRSWENYHASAPVRLLEFAAHLHAESQNDDITECWEDLDEAWEDMKKKMDKYVKDAFGSATI